jgi:hypothetical protein
MGDLRGSGGGWGDREVLRVHEKNLWVRWKPGGTVARPMWFEVGRGGRVFRLRFGNGGRTPRRCVPTCLWPPAFSFRW